MSQRAGRGRNRFFRSGDDAVNAAGHSPEERLRRLAGEPVPGRTARLRLPGHVDRGLGRCLREAHRLSRCGETGEALGLLCGEDRLIRACAAQARAGSGTRLPAVNGTPGILRIATALVGAGERGLTEDALVDAVREFDAVRPLGQRELWALPEALRIAVCAACLRTAQSIVASARACAAAERWVRRPLGSLRGRGADFFERALMLCGEEELDAARARLDRRLNAAGRTPEQMIRQAHDERAWDRMRLENLMSLRRLLDEMDWRERVEALSAVDAELRWDPSGVYPLMDADSRQQLRDDVTRLAERTGLSERSVARHAVAATREAAGALPAGAATLKRLSKASYDVPDALRACCAWWLHDDKGRRALLRRMGRPGVRLPRIVPDPTGRGNALWIAVLTAAAFSLLAAWVRPRWLWPALIPPSWVAAEAVLARVFPRRTRPLRLLKLKVDRVPDAWRTLVVMPVLVPDADRAAAMCDDLETLGCLEPDANIEYLLLGDFADADAREQPGDAALIEAVVERVGAMNARAGRRKYHYLHRPRTLLSRDGRWMGRDRKRGALMALNRVLLGDDGAAEAFMAEEGTCSRLAGRFRYVVTLDADTRMLPETVRRLVGAMAHPMNRPMPGRGWAVMQPRMAALPSACVNGFVRLFAGSGGVDTYPTAVSDLWMDRTGMGAYAGKGIYDVAAFHAALEGALPEGRVLSHDMIEGAIARTATLGDLALYDANPATLNGWLRRQHRWTRGDWQLLPWIAGRALLSNGRRLPAADRFRMAGNLLRSLRAPALLVLLVSGVWLGSADAVAAAMLLQYLDPLLDAPRRDARAWRRATAELAILPLTAFTSLDAALRALWRMGVSGRRLMEWVPSADVAERGAPELANRLAALSMLPGLFRPGAASPALGLAVIFWVGAGWVVGMQDAPVDGAEPLDDAQRLALRALARDTWRFFERCVPFEGGRAAGAAIPPDNLQLDPPAGAARRTSPTNIGLYLLSCVAAKALGLIDSDAMTARLCAAADALEAMPKWRGHPYNWIDIDSLQPLSPRYVSSVDSGNLAACALACAGAIGDAALAARLRALAEGMDFAALYDEKRALFHIGLDADGGGLSRSHYDLLASESRILSYTAILLGQIPAEHWRHLGRGCVAAGRSAVLASWSGTMFEYLMPEILMRAPALSLIGKSCRGAAEVQRRHGKRLGRPWGVSESGYHAFDARMNYQYRAFGLPALALSGNASDGVTAPYASALALAVCPVEAARNLDRMAGLGWRGEMGFYEAADYLRPDSQGAPSLVKSHMAHHQGMVLCAVCNALTGDSLAAAILRDPRARAAALLLEEQAPSIPKRLRRPVPAQPEPAPRPGYARAGRADGRLADAHLLRGREAAALLTADGGVHYVRRGVDATRLTGSLTDRHDAACVHLVDPETGAGVVMGGMGCAIAYDAGSASFTRELGRVRAKLCVSLSPEDDTLFCALELTNAHGVHVRLRAAQVVPVALARTEDYRAHPAFQNLFVESYLLGDCGLLHRRRPRNPGERCPALAHMALGGVVSREADLGRLIGRTGDIRRAGGVDLTLRGGVGATLDAASALAVDVEIAPGETTRLYFALALLDESDSPEAWLARCRDFGMPGRAAQLGRARDEAMLMHLGLTPARYRRADRLSALLMDGRLSAAAKGALPDAGEAPRDALWSLGIPGDRPLIVMTASDAGQADAVRALIGMHAFYRAMGITVDLALVDCGAAGYARPVRDMLEALIAAGPLRGREREPGGVWLLDGGSLHGTQRAALQRAAAMTFDAAEDFDARQRALLYALDVRQGGAFLPLDPGAPVQKREEKRKDNGFGGFADDGYVIEVTAAWPTPAPWSNLLASDGIGLLLTERGGGFLWHGNSRDRRLTPWRGDALREDWGVMLYLYDAASGRALRLLPGDVPTLPFRVRYTPESASYAFAAARVRGETRFTLAADASAALIDVRLENLGLGKGRWQVVCCVDWLMGTDARDAARLQTRAEGGACLAAGAAAGAGWLAAADAGAAPGPDRLRFIGAGSLMAPAGMDEAGQSGDTLCVPVALEPGGACSVRFGIGWAAGFDAARAASRAFSARGMDMPGMAAPENPVIETPDDMLNRMANVFLPHQVRACRVLGRTGLYQPGGAYGFRDQLQDMLALIPSEPDRVREHLLVCAGRQFEAGDALHWWHPPYRGVRTRIRDDRLFLPYVVAAYVRQTGDTALLGEVIPYLADAEIPEGREDVFREMHPGERAGTLHEHCMRAFRATDAVGGHGLALMGAGDWNDGMNRVGARGRGESVWLSEFLAACAADYAEIAPDAEDRAWLAALAGRHRAAVEEAGWDGAWYRRAYMDDGTPLGSTASKCCRIDLIAQAWAVLAGLDGSRCKSAMDAAWKRLVDERRGIIRLLDPPFDLDGPDPGYIRGYPSGVRENGAQYTHGACWLLRALIRMGDGERAHRALRMLLPPNHADTPEAAARYRVEPYVTAADVYTMPGWEGRGGWTWYTGSAAWLYVDLLELLGYERRGNRVRLCALLGEWPRASVTVRFGESRYRLTCSREARTVTLDGAPVGADFIALVDDGGAHEAVFPPREDARGLRT